MNTPGATLADIVWPVRLSGRWLRALALALFGSALVAIAAQIAVPMIPVPMTMQTLAALAVGAAYGSRLGAATLLFYALEGAVGLPVFANFQAGLFLPTGELIATGGYIIGFIAAAALVGWMAEHGWDRNVFTMLIAMILGAAVLYVPGLIWLVAWLMVTKGMMFADAVKAAVVSGLVPFVWGDLIKAVLAAAAFPAAWRVLDRR